MTYGNLTGNFMPIFELPKMFSYTEFISWYFIVSLRDPCDLLALLGVVGVAGGGSDTNGERGTEAGVFLLSEGVHCRDLLDRGSGDSRNVQVPGLSG
jgi:hypothetical protein